jgi:solute carrier family 34 (sodium-dependent phosphate cotransporter)
MAQKLVSADASFSVSSNAPLKSGLDPVVNYLIDIVPAAVVMIIAFILLLSSILLFRKFISELLNTKSPQAFSRFFFQNNWKSFVWGTLTTAAIRSSTITTSVVVPIVAKKIVTFRMAAPFLMGANVGTTVTAFIAAILYSDSVNALSIAIAHFLFNAIGVLLFFPVSALREIPIRLSLMLGKATVDNRAIGFVFLLLNFFFIPFLVIYFSAGT